MDYQKIGERIKQLRKARCITQKQLGEAIMRSESTITKYEQGIVDIPPAVLMDISKYFCVDEADLLGIANTNPCPTPYSTVMRLLETVGYKIVELEEENWHIITLRNIETYENYTVSKDVVDTLVNNISSYTKFQIQEIIKNSNSENK